MNDRELLELSAKSVGINLEYRRGSDAYYYDEVENGREEWLPLHDNAQAFKLACSLCMIVNTGPCEASASTISGVLRGFVAREETINQGQDIAVRRAIVRAAAEIGKSMQ